MSTTIAIFSCSSVCYISFYAPYFENMERKVYRVRTQYVFEGVFEVVATDREEAERKILEDCGMVMGRGIHSTCPMNKSIGLLIPTPKNG